MSAAIKTTPAVAVSGKARKVRKRKNASSQQRRVITTSVNFERGVLRAIRRDVRKSKGQFRSVSGWINYNAAKLTGVNI